VLAISACWSPKAERAQQSFLHRLAARRQELLCHGCCLAVTRVQQSPSVAAHWSRVLDYSISSPWELLANSQPRFSFSFNYYYENFKHRSLPVLCGSFLRQSFYPPVPCALLICALQTDRVACWLYHP